MPHGVAVFPTVMHLYALVIQAYPSRYVIGLLEI
jgi:hypothetical protein